MSEFLSFSANPHSASHSLGWKANQAVEKAASLIAHSIGANQDEVIFTSGATEANNLALLGLGRASLGGKRDRILVSAIEHKSVLGALDILKNYHGYSVEKIPVDEEGLVILPALKESLADDVLLVSIAAVNSEIGTIQDIPCLSSLVQKFGSVFHCDAAQTPMAMAMSEFADCIDLLSLSAHKMYGPKGIGALYIRRDLQDKIEPLIYGGGQQSGLRSGTVPVPLCVGMGAATEIFTKEDMTDKRANMICHRDMLIKGLCDLSKNIALNGPVVKNRHPGNANMRFNGFNAFDLLGALQPFLAASVGSACTTGIPEPSYVLREIGLNGEEAESSIRFSIGFETREQDIREAIALISQALNTVAGD